MTIQRLAFHWGLALSILSISCGPAPQRPEQARQAIQAVLDTQTEAWNRGDLESFMAGYWNSSELTFFSGNTATSSWERTLQRYRLRYQGEGREMGRLRFEDVRVEILAADAAFVRGRFRLELSSGERPTGLFTLIVKRFEEGWRIVHDHTSS